MKGPEITETSPGSPSASVVRKPIPRSRSVGRAAIASRDQLDLVGRPRLLISGLLSRAGARAPRDGGSVGGATTPDLSGSDVHRRRDQRRLDPGHPVQALDRCRQELPRDGRTMRRSLPRTRSRSQATYGCSRAGTSLKPTPWGLSLIRWMNSAMVWMKTDIMKAKTY